MFSVTVYNIYILICAFFPRVQCLLLFLIKNSFYYFLKADEILNLKEQLMKKDDDMRQMEERYKKYLDKAKQVITSYSRNCCTREIFAVF